MASRGIANMHLFFEMKNKFPELPEDLIRQYVYQCSEDQEKCLQLLNKECETHGYSKNPFTEFPVSHNPTGSNTGISATNGFDSKLISSNSIPLEQMRLQTMQPLFHYSQELNSPPKISFVSKKCTFSHAEVLQSPDILEDPGPSLPQDICSVFNKSEDIKVSNTDKRSPPSTSHSIGTQFPTATTSKCLDKRETFFSKTEELQHFSSSSKTFNSSSNKRHTVKLNVTPTFPYYQQYEAHNICGNSSATCTSHARKHTTSVNLQLRIPSADNHPVSVIATPISTRNTKCTDDFDSHLHISISSNGASFIARRLQRSPASQCSVRQSTVPSKRPTILNLHLPSSHHASSKMSLSPERTSLGKKLHPVIKLHTGQLRSSVLSEIPETQEALKSDWLHYLPSPYQNEDFFKIYFPVSAQKEQEVLPKKAFHHYASSLDEKQNYVHAILAHQKVKLEMLQTEIQSVKKIHAELLIEIDIMEEKISQKQTQNSKDLHFEDMQKLKEENQNLRIECNCLLMEIDVQNINQAPLGITGRDFYSRIFTGSTGPIPTIPSGNEGTEHSENELPKTTEKYVTVTKDIDNEKGNKWICKNCTSTNNQTLKKCEFCKQTQISDYFDSGTNHHSVKDSGAGPPILSGDKLVKEQSRTIGSVQISVTQNRSSAKGLQLQLTHRVHR